MINDKFNFITLLATLVFIYTLWELSVNWSTFWDKKVTIADQRLASQVAVFLLVPIGVLLHEVGHSIATWQVGGTVETFRWFIFSGYIIPAGNFSSWESWWISFAGNLVSIILIILPIPFIFNNRKRIIGEMLYAFVILQSIYTLIYYPIWSIFDKRGDWNTIYSSDFQPYTYVLLIAHLGLLWLLWKIFNSEKMLGWKLNRNLGASNQWHKLKLKESSRPNDLQPKLDLVYFLIDHNEVYTARKIANKIILNYSRESSIKVLRLFLDCHQNSYDPVNYNQVIKSAKKLLYSELSLDNQIIIDRILASCLYRKGDLDEALDFANRGLAIDPHNYMLLFHRMKIYQLFNKYNEAILDGELALENVSNEYIRELILQLRQKCLIKIDSNSSQ